MADYNSMKVPELKKLLSERGLTQAGNKADLIARLVDNDKEQAKSSEPQAAPEAKKNDIEDEIDYEDDDYAAPNAPKSTVPPAAASAAAPNAAPVPAASATPAPAPTKSAAPEAETMTPAATTTADAPTTSKPSENDADKTAEAAAPAEPLFSQHLAPTNAQSEAEKRAARAARFGITADKEPEEAKKTERASRFGIANDAVSAIDSALPDRPRKRGRDRGGEEKEDDVRSNKRQTSGAVGPARGGRNAAGRGNNQNSRGDRGGDRGGRRDRRGGAPKEGGAPNGQKKGPSAAVDPAEKAKLEARAKRFGAAA